MRSIYSFYKERLIEISGKSRSLYCKGVSKKYSYDIGKIIGNDAEVFEEFMQFLWRGKKYTFNLISKEDKDRLYKVFSIEDRLSKSYEELAKLEGKEKSSFRLKIERQKKEELARVMQSEVTSLTALKREIEEFSKETGRYELFIGYPFVTGAISKDIVVKAPLLLFPCVIDVIDDTTVDIELKHDEHIQLNKVLMLAYAKEKRINIEELDLDFSSPIASRFKTIEELISYLRDNGIKFNGATKASLENYDKIKEPRFNDALELKNACILGRFPLANAIYNDYTMLEKKRLYNEAINELLNLKQPKHNKKFNPSLYTINNLDFAQENTIYNINKDGNCVIYGPPGTGKSQTIVNIIADAICKNKKILVVSQKKAALDVVFNRLGLLNSKVMFVTDAEKNKTEFYDRAKNTHIALMGTYSNAVPNAKFSDEREKFENIEKEIQKELNELDIISNCLFSNTEFGIPLQKMYEQSHMIGRNTYEYTIYKNMLKNSELMAIKYNDLADALRVIQEKNKDEMYYKFLEAKEKNPLIDNIKSDLDLHIVNQTLSKLNKVLSSRLAPFDTGKYPNSKQILAFYLDTLNTNNDLKPLIKFVSRVENPKTYKALSSSYVLLPALPFTKYNAVKKEKEVEKEFERTVKAIDEYTQDYTFLKTVLTERGYLMLIDNLLNGNTLYLKLIFNALSDYVEIRDLNFTLNNLTENEKLILNFAYSTTDSFVKFKQVIEKLLVIRVYREVVVLEEQNKEELSKILDYDNVRNRILSLLKEKQKIAQSIALEKFKNDYIDGYNKDKESKNYYYQISKQQNLWPIRKTMEVYGHHLLNLFPCWLLSPESVSTIMPLEKDMFDMILFDEASQVFVENTIPTIYRGKNIVIAGDNKQLRPTSTFMKRYVGNDFDEELDFTTQTALEVESLLDLAMCRYNSSNLTYHYRSQNEELINFSNYVFYEGKLQISPNITKNIGKKPIERIKVAGRWVNRKNQAEAKEVVEILKKIFKTRKENETIGIITFNSEQENAIEDIIDRECRLDAKFKADILKETNRKENGEDTSLFVKNIENVQGDERDIIIFSIGYAENEYGKVIAHFGPLSMEGGENRLNVAVTRAKKKIYVVTSIEPEELKVEGTKNLGPKIFKNYLKYVRAVSNGDKLETKLILDSYVTTASENEIKKTEFAGKVEEQIATELKKLGYEIATNIGNSTHKIGLGIYDKNLDKYLVGIECDYNAYYSSVSTMERDVLRPSFLQSRGWNLVRVWSRDWWLNKNKVLNKLVEIAEKQKRKFINELDEISLLKYQKKISKTNK
ncbi:MAG: hypothetical protein IJZ29_03645 [Clostridia bacterium]|nr:hypothetical protein [Clostridia bacterium]